MRRDFNHYGEHHFASLEEKTTAYAAITPSPSAGKTSWENWQAEKPVKRFWLTQKQLTALLHETCSISDR
jgi:hypothetical protein